MKTNPSSAIKKACGLTLLWLAISLSGVFLLGAMPDSVGRLQGFFVLPLAFHLLILNWVTQKGVLRIATSSVPLWQRWTVFAMGLGFVAISYLAIRHGAPFRNVWESLTTCGQLLVVVVAAGYLPRFLKSPAEMLPLISMMICADLVSFLVGPTHGIAKEVAAYYGSGRQGIYPISEVLLMKFGAVGSMQLFPLFGVADWFMVVFLFSSARVFKLKDSFFGVSFAVFGLFFSSVSAQVLNVFIPALPVLALVFLAAMLVRYPGSFRPTKREVLLTLWPPLIAGGILVGKGIF